MTIKTKVLKLIEYPSAVMSYKIGIHPNYFLNFHRLRRFIIGDLKTYLDVGANIGQFVKATKYFYPNTKVYAFEPVPNIYQGGGEFFEIGLSDKKEESIFYENVNCDAWSSLHKPINDHNIIFESAGNFKETKVQLDRFDNLNLKIERPCLLKIDTEGHEYQVLEGFGDRLNEIDVIQLEYLGMKYYSDKTVLSEIIKLLEGYGFDGMVQLNLRYYHKLPLQYDLVFFRLESLE